MTADEEVDLTVTLSLPRRRLGRVMAMVEELRAMGVQATVELASEPIVSHHVHLAIVEPRRHLGPDGQGLVEQYVVRCRCGWQTTANRWEAAREQMLRHNGAITGEPS